MKLTPLRFAMGVGTSQLLTGGGRLIGWSFLEGSGVATASLNLWDSSTSAQNLLLPVTLNISESARDWQAIHPIPFEEGIFLQIVSGTVAGVVWAHPCNPYDDWLIPVFVVEA